MATASRPAAIDLVAARNAAMQCCNAIEGVRIAAAVSKHQSLPFNTDSVARLGQAADAGRWLIQASPRPLLLASSGPVRTMSGFSPTAHQAAFDLARSMWLTVRDAICCESIACGESFYDGEGDGFALATEKVQRFSAAIVEAVIAYKLPDAMEIRAAVELESARAGAPSSVLATPTARLGVDADATTPERVAVVEDVDSIARTLTSKDVNFKSLSVHEMAQAVPCSVYLFRKTKFWIELQTEQPTRKRMKITAPPDALSLDDKTEAFARKVGGNDPTEILIEEEIRVTIEAIRSSSLSDLEKGATIAKVRSGEMSLEDAREVAQIYSPKQQPRRQIQHKKV